MEDSVVSKHDNQFIPEDTPLVPPKKHTPEPSNVYVEHNLLASLKIIFRYLMAELKKKQRAFKIGFGTILIVVTFLTALGSGIESVPLAFLKVAENQASEADLIILPTKTTIYNPPNAVV